MTTLNNENNLIDKDEIIAFKDIIKEKEKEPKKITPTRLAQEVAVGRPGAGSSEAKRAP